MIQGADVHKLPYIHTIYTRGWATRTSSTTCMPYNMFGLQHAWCCAWHLLPVLWIMQQLGSPAIEHAHSKHHHLGHYIEGASLVYAADAMPAPGKL